jgi:nitrate reductase assembly molybdenum cofactor insertion protein NarJ
MHSYTITDAQEHYREVFDRAKQEPILLTDLIANSRSCRLG